VYTLNKIKDYWLNYFPPNPKVFSLHCIHCSNLDNESDPAETPTISKSKPWKASLTCIRSRLIHVKILEVLINLSGVDDLNIRVSPKDGHRAVPIMKIDVD
jgi:hypothetical protein